MSSRSTPSIAFTLSLIGGLFVVVGSIVAVSLSSFGSPYSNYYGMGPGMMRGYYGFGHGLGTGWLLGLSLVALVCGIMVVVGAIMLNVHPADHITWGIIVLVFSAASFIGMGGYFIGALLGIAGGAIALSWRKQPQVENRVGEKSPTPNAV